MSVKLGNKTLGRIISSLRLATDEFTEENIPSKVITDEINEAVDEWRELSSNKDHEEYMERVEVNVERAKMVCLNSDYGTFSYNATTKVLTVDITASANALWKMPEGMDAGFDDTWLNAKVVLMRMEKTGGVSPFLEVFTGYVDEILTESTCKIRTNDTISANIPEDVDEILLGSVEVYNGVDVIDLDALELFDKIDKIHSIESDLHYLCVEKSQKKFIGIQNEDENEAWENSIIWNRRGHLIYLHKGTEVSEYGTLYINYPRNCIAMVSRSDYIDVKPSNMAQIKIIVNYRLFKLLKNVKIPPTINEAYNNLQKAYSAELAERAAKKNE